jgi:3-oxoacyl-[acyl-carrier protein] reductase
MSLPIVVVLSGNSELGLGIVGSLLQSKKWNVISTYRKSSESLVKKYAENSVNSSKSVFQLDLSSWAETSKTFSAIAAEGNIWGVINCVGEASAKTIKNLTSEDIVESLRTNVVSAFNATKGSLEVMALNGDNGGRIIHLSSVVVRRPVLGVVPYAMSKSAIEGLVKSAASELGRKKITINDLRLGYFDRGMAKRDVPMGLLDEVAAQTAVRQLGTPENLSAAINYLLSNESLFQTGSIIDLDGGLV